MATAYVLYNKKAGDGNVRECVEPLGIIISDKPEFIDVTELSDYRAFFDGLKEEDYIILAGGDGTLNRFVNNIDGIKFENKVFYYPNGTGNDFAYDMGYPRESTPFQITDQIKDLPTVTVNGKTRRFINGIGYGIDGYCCQVGDELKKLGKKANYTAIAIKGLLFHYKPTAATVTVDGRTSRYERVWPQEHRMATAKRKRSPLRR